MSDDKKNASVLDLIKKYFSLLTFEEQKFFSERDALQLYAKVDSSTTTYSFITNPKLPTRTILQLGGSPQDPWSCQGIEVSGLKLAAHYGHKFNFKFIVHTMHGPAMQMYESLTNIKTQIEHVDFALTYGNLPTATLYVANRSGEFGECGIPQVCVGAVESLLPYYDVQGDKVTHSIPGVYRRLSNFRGLVYTVSRLRDGMIKNVAIPYDATPTTFKPKELPYSAYPDKPAVFPGCKTKMGDTFLELNIHCRELPILGSTNPVHELKKLHNQRPWDAICIGDMSEFTDGVAKELLEFCNQEHIVLIGANATMVEFGAAIGCGNRAAEYGAYLVDYISPLLDNPDAYKTLEPMYFTESPRMLYNPRTIDKQEVEYVELQMLGIRPIDEYIHEGGTLGKVSFRE